MLVESEKAEVAMTHPDCPFSAQRCGGCERRLHSSRGRHESSREVMSIPGTLSHLTVVLALCLGSPACAEDASAYPTKPVRVIVPVGAGAGIDTAARVTAEAVEKHLGQRIIIENKPGAGLRIGTAQVAKSPPDGYTLLFTSPSPIAVVEHFSQNLDYVPA